MDNKLLNVLINDSHLTEFNLKQLTEEYLNDSEIAELSSTLCDVISQVDDKWYSLYKITVILKYLCDKKPEKLSSLLKEKKKILESLKNFTHKDNYGMDQGLNVRINVEQILNFVEEENNFNDKENAESIFQTSDRLNRAADRLLQTLDSIDDIDSERTLKKLKFDVAEFSKYLPGPMTFEKFNDIDKNPRIDEDLYAKLVERIVRKFDDDWPLVDEKIAPTIERLIIVDGSTFFMFHETLIVLTDALKNSPNVRVTRTIAKLLENLLKSDSPLNAMLEICRMKNKSAMEREDIECKWKLTIQLIVSLSSRIANKLDGKMEYSFLPDNYSKIITFHVTRAMKFLADIEKDNSDELDVKMISMLIGKAVITLGAEKFESMIDLMSRSYRENPQQTRNSMIKILSQIDRRAIEAIAVLFLKREESILGDDFQDLLDDPNWRHVFTVKIPLMSYHKSDNVAKNLIKFLSSSTKNERCILFDLLMRLLDIWGDKSALNHTSFDQHEYITRLIILSMREVEKILTTIERENLRRLLFSGISCHLESTQCELRAIGMITGEMVIEMLNISNDEPKLQYDYAELPPKIQTIVEKLRRIVDTDESKNLPQDENLSAGKIVFENTRDKRLYELALDCGIIEEASLNNCDIEKITENVKSMINIDDSSEPISSHQDSTCTNDENLDSDDDLVPYDMSNDTPIVEKLRPTYLRDLRENLLNSHTNNDPNVFSESMIAAEDLIMSQLPKDDATFAIELLQLFVNLKENSYTENFELLKYKCCVAIVIVCPKKCAEYLCNEFHTKIDDYSISDRVFILEILAEAARRLSKIEIKPKIEISSRNRDKKFVAKRVSLAVDANYGKKHETLYDDDFEVAPYDYGKKIDWQEIVEKRIESNTRRFAHSTKYSKTTINRFNDVASSFFYPLLYGFFREGTWMQKISRRFEDQGNILLVSYLRTLSCIVLAAENCVIVPKMAKEMMDLAWTLRYHNQAKVRLSVIQIVASTVGTLPKEGLGLDLMELIFEFREWLIDVSDDGVRGDPDSDCRNLGKNVVALINSMFKSTLDEFQLVL